LIYKQNSFNVEFKGDRMKRRMLILAITVALIIIISVTSIMYLRQKIPLSYDATLTVVPGWPWADLKIWFHTSNILYNCKVTVSYLSTNGSWTQITQDVGTVDANAQPQSHMFELTDYPTGDNSTVVHLSDADHLDTLRINAYGYITAYITF